MKDTDLEEWQALCARCTVGGIMPVTFRAFRVATDDEKLVSGCGIQTLVVQAQMIVLERDRNVLHKTYHHDAPRGDPDVQLLFTMARTLYLHELEEQWLVDGDRVRDPHAERNP